MPQLPERLRLPAPSDPPSDQVLTGPHWRFSVLDAGLVRLEWSPSGRFVDQASQTVVDRRIGGDVQFTVRRSEQTLELVTSRLHLTYDLRTADRPFTANGLSVQARGGHSAYHSIWHYGQPTDQNLGGTARTLDMVDGRTSLGDGVIARSGIAVLDDSHTVLLDDAGWFAPREQGSIDVYVFCFGQDYRQALQTFYRLTGEQPLIPRFALGTWWSRYHPYTDDEYLALTDRFAAEGIPLSVAVLDMDWHPVDIDPELGSGWTGYSWNRELFPDPPAFLRGLHERGLAVTLNVHPADGIRAHEDSYRQAAEALGRSNDEITQGLPIRFDPTDPAFLRVYLDVVHHPLERDGVDFWWLDWQSGQISSIPGLDPLWLLNHLHYLDSGRPDGRMPRPMTFSRYAGPGSHRYPIGFSGDTIVSWASLAFQPEFTATATNIGYGWWSHDIGGHMFGVKDDELATRWVQLGVFSPILRLHSTSDPFNSKEPWRFGEVARRVMTRYLRLRHQLLPYLASEAYHVLQQGGCLVEPMYYEYPGEDAAYRVPNQFRFGGQLMLAPVTTPIEPCTRRAATTVWLPQGDWVDLTTGLSYTGRRTITMHRTLDTLPVLARPGSIVPLLPEPVAPQTDSPQSVTDVNSADVNSADVKSTDVKSTDPADRLEIWLVAGADGSYTLAEDRDDDDWSFTTISYEHETGTLSVAPTQGGTAAPERRTLDLVLIAFTDVHEITIEGASSQTLATRPGPIPGSRRVQVGEVLRTAGVRVLLDGDRTLADNDVPAHVFEIIDQAQVPFAVKTELWDAVRSGPAATAALAVRGVAETGTSDVDRSQRRHLGDCVLEVLLARPT